MAKTKPRQLAARPSSKTASQSGILDSSKLDFKADLCAEDGWVMVKKQRVIILVPPLPAAENSTLQKSALTPSQSQPRTVIDTRQKSPLNAVDTGQKSPTNMVGTQQKCRVETSPDIASVDEPEKLAAVNPRSASQETRKAPSLSQQDFRMEPENPDGVGSLKLQKIHRVPIASKRTKWPRAMCNCSLLEGNASLKQRLRASNLEKKLERAGGLNRWLASIGVGGQFRRILRGKRMSKLQIANLTMEKLKEMGALAVGPRRKLIHAIYCVCHPYCFGAP